ncbi:MAG: hypothetical protein E7399_00305 [Ruminococcaceae bacterium]|nr:hypothetical protein [Oscillospiraceae bacterium]
MDVSVKRSNGVLKVEIDGVLYDPVSFKSFRPSERNISDFAKAGVKLFSILVSGLQCGYDVPYSLYGDCWFGKGNYNFDAVDKQIEFFRAHSPGCYYAIMIHLDTRDWWHQIHENFPKSFDYLSQVIWDREWREATADYLKAMMEHVEEKYGDCVYGYFMLCGKGTEWFSHIDFQESHPIKEAYYREYTNNPNATIPKKEEMELSAELSFYEDENVISYQRAHAELIADTILYFATEAQKVIQHKKLLGLYFGYYFEFGNPNMNYINDAGHLALEKVYFSDDINMISSPASYSFREPDSTSAFMTLYKTLDLHDKLYFFEYDQRTYLSQEFALAGAGYYCKTDREAVDLMRRDFMLCASNGTALWWFDMFEGWYASEGIMNGVSKMVEITNRLSKIPCHSVAEVAIIGFPQSMYKVNKRNNIHYSLASGQREGYMRLGAPFDSYVAGDLGNIDFSQYKLVVLLDGFDMTSQHAQVIENLKQAGKTILWMYAPDFCNGGLKRMKELTEMELSEMKERPSSADHGVRLPTPGFCITDKDAVALSKYDNGKVAVAYKNTGRFLSVYSGIGKLDAEILRKICRIAGVHLYSETDPVYRNNCLLGVYAFEDTVLYVKEDGIYEDLFSGKRYRSEKGCLTVPKEEYASKLLILIS